MFHIIKILASVIAASKKSKSKKYAPLMASMTERFLMLFVLLFCSFHPQKLSCSSDVCASNMIKMVMEIFVNTVLSSRYTDRKWKIVVNNKRR
jgi:putative flippase GtrA